jgi:predicted Zn-dependent protease
VIVRPALWVLCAALALCGTEQAAGPDKPASAEDTLPLNYTPPPDSDEAGLWMTSGQLERSFQTSPLLVRDPALNAYVKRVVCKLVPERCDSIRIYILDVPYFNAAMSPNGTMQVWTGLLLRAHNEAQLAFILGHETSHYLLRHTVSLWRRARDTSGFAAFFTIATAGVGALATFAMMDSLMAYSRDEEREADARGLELATAAGYEPEQNAFLWRELLAEEKTIPKHEGIFEFTNNHPDTQERMATMTKRAGELEPTHNDWVVGTDDYRKATAAFRERWLEEDLGLGHYDASLLLINNLLLDEPNSGELKYFQGEIYRRRNAEGDAQKAMDAYHVAIADGGAPAAVYRGLGLSEMKAGDKASARQAFVQYLAAAPTADDRAMIEYYLSHL